MGKVSSVWSRLWGAMSAAAFWVGLGAAVLDALVIAPLWTSSPPLSVRAWADLAVRPEPERFFVPLAAFLALGTLLAWLSDLTIAGARRWWLTLATVAAFGVLWASAAELVSIERAVTAAAAHDDLAVVGLASDWLRWSLLRFGALAMGSYAAYRGHLAALLARRLPGRADAAGHANRDGGRVIRGKGPVAIAETRGSSRRAKRREDFVWNEDDE